RFQESLRNEAPKSTLGPGDERDLSVEFRHVISAPLLASSRLHERRPIPTQSPHERSRCGQSGQWPRLQSKVCSRLAQQGFFAPEARRPERSCNRLERTHPLASYESKRLVIQMGECRRFVPRTKARERESRIRFGP